MIVICNECGKKYKINPSLLKDGETLVLCSSTDDTIRQNTPEQGLGYPPQSVGSPDKPKAAPLTFQPTPEKPKAGASTSKSRSRGVGLRGKILLLFFIIPVALIAVAGYLFLGQLNQLSSIIRGETTGVVTDVAESIVSEKGLAVARQVKLFLNTHPNIQPEDLHKNTEFMKIAVQKVGVTGYTVLNWAPHEDKPWLNLAGPNAPLILKDVSKQLQKKFTEADYRVFQGMRDEALKTRQLVTGYYRFLDDKEKFQAMVPVEGTDFWLVATTYLDEFTQPMNTLKAKANDITDATRTSVLAIIVVTALLVAVIAFFYGNRLSGKIRRLKDIADSISIGDMDVEIDTSDKDELGDLAAAITRMQESIRLSIDRLRSRKARQAA